MLEVRYTSPKLKLFKFASIVTILGTTGCGSVGFSDNAATTQVSSIASSSSTTNTPTLPPEPSTSVLDSSDSEGIATLLSSGEPFLVGLMGIDLPELPTEIPGFVRYDGLDASGLSGAIRRSELRLFEGESEPRLVFDFTAQMNGCNDAVWVLRWVSKNEDILIQSTNEVDGMASESSGEPPEENPFAPYVADESWYQDATTSGIMSGSICSQPGFRFARALDTHPSIPPGATLLVDVVIEWSYYDRDYFAGG